MKIYGISGLGADKRVFEYLSLKYEFIPIEWIKPIENECIIEYSRRLSEVIDTTDRFCVIGVSFGGLIATEISKLLRPEVTILISSAETKNELNPLFRVFGKTQIIKILPIAFFNPPRWIAHFLFGTQQKELLNQILDDTDLSFAKWALEKLINWKNSTSLERVIKISGTKDRLIPPRGDSKMILIDGGAHFMIVDRAEEISSIINKELNKIAN